MTPLAWAIRPLKKYADFTGRAPRAEFWWFFLFTTVIYLVALVGLIGVAGSAATPDAEPSIAMLGTLGLAAIFIGLFWLAIIIPTIAVQVRRMHDLNRSGWWIGGFYLLYIVYTVMALGPLVAVGAAGDPSPAAIGSMIGLMVVLLAFTIYAIVLLVFFCTRGTQGANRYGPDPYGDDVAEVFA